MVSTDFPRFGINVPCEESWHLGEKPLAIVGSERIAGFPLCSGCLSEFVDEVRCSEVRADDYGIEFAHDGSALRAANADNPRVLPCPTCGSESRMTPDDIELGYQCDTCADAVERGRDIYPYEISHISLDFTSETSERGIARAVLHARNFITRCATWGQVVTLSVTIDTTPPKPAWYELREGDDAPLMVEVDMLDLGRCGDCNALVLARCYC